MKKCVTDILKLLEKTRLEYWNISPELGKFLNLLIKVRKPKKVFEIGTSNGYSGIWMAEALSKTKGHLWTMESHKKERFYLAKINFKKAGLEKFITPLLGHAPENLPSSPKIFDLIFLDATKMEYLSYFDALKNRVKKGGLIIADNIDSHKKAVDPYLKKVLSDKKWHSVKLNIGSGILVSLKLR